MNKNSSLQDIIDACQSLELGISFYAEKKENFAEIMPMHGKGYEKFTIEKNSYLAIIEYLAKKLDQPTIKKLQNYQAFEYEKKL